MSQEKSSLEPIRTFGNTLATDVCLKLKNETGVEWLHETKADLLDFKIIYKTDSFKYTSEWSVFDASRPYAKGTDPLVYFEEMVRIDYDRVLMTYQNKAVVEKKDESKNATRKRRSRATKRNIESN